MKEQKLSAQGRALERNPELYVEKQGDEYIIFFRTLSGKHTLGRGRDEDAAWRNVLVYYGIK